MKHAPPFDGTLPNTDVDCVGISDVARPVSDERVTGKLAKFLDLLDTEMAERWADKSAA